MMILTFVSTILLLSCFEQNTVFFFNKMKDFQKRYPDSILKARVGFMSPNTNNHIKSITYEEVCHASNSDFVEVLHVTLRDPHRHFEELIKFFFSFHDPTTMNRQGNDLGFQYGSYIFYQDEEQAKIAKRVRQQLREHIQNGKIKSFQRKVVTTKIIPVNIFIKAKREHQQYLMKNPRGYW